MKLTLAPFPLLVALALAAGCGGGEGTEPPAEAGSLEGVPWVLSAGVDVDGWEATPPTAAFDGGTVAGSTGCNRYSASYTLDGDAVELGPIASTKMACRPPADAVEREYVAALERVAGWRLEDGQLVLLDADDGELLRYDAGPASEG